MALEGYVQNDYSPRTFGDVSNVYITIVSGATPRDAARSSPDTTVTDATGGVYTFTLPKSVFTLVAACKQVGQAASVNANITTTAAALTAGSGTVTLSDSNALGAGEEIHLIFQSCAP